MIEGVLERVPDAQNHRPPDKIASPGTPAVFRNVESNTLLMHLDQHGIAASSGSACKVGIETFPHP